MKKTVIIPLIISSLFLSSQNKNLNRFPDLQHKVGSHFPIEIFTRENGQNYNSTFLEGKPSLVNFWSTSCEPCLEELPYLNRLKNSLQGKANFVAITYDNKDKVDRFLLKKEFNFLLITNALQQLQSYFPIIRNPMSFMIDKNGTIKEIYGSISADNFKTIQKSLQE